MTKFELYMDGEWFYSNADVDTVYDYACALVESRLTWLDVTKKGVKEYIRVDRVTRIRMADYISLDD